MRSIVICCLFFFACNEELPTEPRLEVQETNVIETGCPEQAATVDGGAVVMKPNSVSTATVRVCFPPAVLPWEFFVGPPEIAEGHAMLAAGQTSTTLTISAKSLGTAAITYSVGRFGHANSTGLVGRILVVNSFKRRSASH